MKPKSIEELYKNDNLNCCIATHENMNMMLLWDTKVVETTAKTKYMNIFYCKIIKEYKPNIFTTNSYDITTKFYLVKDPNVRFNFYEVHRQPKIRLKYRSL